MSALKARTDLVTEALANLGIVSQADSGAPRTQADLVTEALANLGVVQQPDGGVVQNRAALINNVLFILGVLSAGQPTAAEDYAAVDTRVDTVLADLNARVIATVANTAQIPAAWFDAISVIVANVCKEKYGVTGDEAVKLATEVQLAEAKLKTLNRGAVVNEKIPQIVAELNARNICTVSDLAAIPAAWFSALADIVAFSVLGKFDVAAPVAQIVTARAPIAERMLRNLNNANIVDRNIDPILADLAARQVVYLVDQTEIPDEWFVHLAAIVADRCKAKGFDLDTNTIQRVSAEGAQAMMELRELTRGRPSYLSLATSYL